MLSSIFLHQWQRKLAALLSAVLVWFLVNNSIIETKTLPNIPVRVVNLPADKTIAGLLPNNILGKRITLTLSGTKDVVRELESGDLEVVLDASMADSNEWVVQITKKNLVSLNPSINLASHISEISHPEFVINLSPLTTAKVPLTILKPDGEPPAGYNFLDVWPKKLMQTVSGPAEQVEKLKDEGLFVTFDMNLISSQELDSIRATLPSNHDDEVNFYLPNKWKHVSIPFRDDMKEEINDPETECLRIEFLRKGYHAIEKELPINVFYPLKYSTAINPQTFTLSVKNKVKEENGLTYFTTPLYLYNVSKLFVDIIRDNMEIFILAAPPSERETLQWSVEVIDAHDLEDTYVALHLAKANFGKAVNGTTIKRREELLRRRFREFMQRLRLYVQPGQKLFIESFFDKDQIVVQ